MKDKSKSFKVIAGGTLAVLSLIGTIPLAASAATLPSGTPVAVVSQNGNEATETDIETTAELAKEAAENAALAAQAKLTEQQAIDAAKAANTGATVVIASLGDENGKVVYEVRLTSANGNSLEVKVDAINGTILSTDDENVEYQD